MFQVRVVTVFRPVGSSDRHIADLYARSGSRSNEGRNARVGMTDVFNAPPALPEPAAVAVTALAGMLSPAPSLRAAAPFTTHAQTVTLVRPGVITHDVWIVLVVLPDWLRY